MIFWLVIAAMTSPGLRGLARSCHAGQGLCSGGDVAVYRDQLDEIERDRNAGLIDDSERKPRIEVSRRLLESGRNVEASRPVRPPPAESRAGRRAALIAAIVVIPRSRRFYYRLPAWRRLAEARAAAEPGRTRRSIADGDRQGREITCRRDPDDAKSWQVLALVYQRLERYDDAVNAWRNIIRLNGENADNLESPANQWSPQLTAWSRPRRHGVRPGACHGQGGDRRPLLPEPGCRPGRPQRRRAPHLESELLASAPADDELAAPSAARWPAWRAARHSPARARAPARCRTQPDCRRASRRR